MEKPDKMVGLAPLGPPYKSFRNRNNLARPTAYTPC